MITKMPHSIVLIYQGVTRDIVRGKGKVSLMSSVFVIHRIKRSMPSPKPPCGTEPYFREIKIPIIGRRIESFFLDPLSD